MLSEQEIKDCQVLLERKQSDIARLKLNLSDENKVARRQRATQAVKDEEKSILQQITKIEAEVQESLNG